MTAPTPDLEAHLRALSSRATEGGMYEANKTLLVGDMAAALIEAADTLAAVTADHNYERTQHEITKQTLDQAWEELHASKQMHEQARTLLDQTLTERDEIQAETHKVAEMYRIVVKQLADAPHDSGCASGTMANVDEFYPCSCWKAGL